MSQEQNHHEREGSDSDDLSYTIEVWRQQGPNDKGQMASYPLKQLMAFFRRFMLLNVGFFRIGGFVT